MYIAVGREFLLSFIAFFLGEQIETKTAMKNQLSHLFSSLLKARVSSPRETWIGLLQIKRGLSGAVMD